jgi:3-keto-5-aminohexanoate cleavage enzyme
VRSVAMFIRNGMHKAEMGRPELNLVMGVASGMPCDADLLELLLRWMPPQAVWQTTLIGRSEVWPVHQRTAELGGMLRTGLEDTFYLPSGAKASGNGPLVEALAQCAHRAGRRIASPAQARVLLGLKPRLATA